MSRANCAALIILALSFALPVQAQTTATDWIKKAQECVYDGDDQGANQACNTALSLEPKNVEAWNLRADTNLPWGLANPSNARRDYSQALALDPTNYRALTYRGYLSYLDNTTPWKVDLENAIKILKAIPNRTAEQQRLYAMAAYWQDAKSSWPVVKRAAESVPDDTEILFLLGCTLDSLGRTDEAKAIFKQNQKLLVDELQHHCSGNLCRKLMRGCSSLLNYREMIKVFSDYLKKHPDNVHALYWRGYLFNQENRPKEALRDYAKSVELGPKYQSHLTAYGDFEVSRKKYREAAALYRRAITNDPTSETTIVKRAQSLKELKMSALAIQELDRYLMKNPLAHQILRAKATIEQKDNPEQARQDRTRALAVLSQKIKETPELAKLYSLRSSLYQDLSQPQKALADCDQAIRLKSDDAALYNLRAHLKWNYLNLKTEAIADVIRAIDCAPSYSKRAYLVVLSVYYKGDKQYDKAIETADKCIALSPENPDGYKLKAECYMDRGRFHDALANLQKISTMSIELDDIDLLFARLYVRLNRQKEALTAFNTSLNKHPENLEARVARGVLHSQMGQYDLALNDFNKALTIAPDNSDTYFARSRAYGSKGEYLKAAADLTRGMQLSKQTDAPWLLEDRARFYTYAEHYREAAADLSEAYRYALDKPLYLYQCGKLLYWSGNKLAAIDSISAYLKLVPDLRALRARARCYFETDQFEKSIQDYSSLIEGDPENPVFYRLRAKSYLKSGNQQLASADMDKAKSLMKSK